MEARSSCGQGLPLVYRIEHHYQHFFTKPQTEDGDGDGDEVNSRPIRKTGKVRSLLTGLQGLLVTKRWNTETQKLQRLWPGIVVSACGKFIAVLGASVVTILKEEDGFIQPSGHFQGFPEASSPTFGVWIRGQNILAVATNANMVIVLDLSGRELQNVSFQKGKSKGHIIGIFEVIIQEDFRHILIVVVMSDGTLYHVIIDEDALKGSYKLSIECLQTSVKKQHAKGISCLDFSPDESVLALAGPGREEGKYAVSLWKIKESLSTIALLSCARDLPGCFFEQFWCDAANHSGTFFPKLIISESLRYLAVLDCKGCLHVLSMKKNNEWLLEDVGVNSSKVGSKEDKLEGGYSSNQKYFALYPPSKDKGRPTMKSHNINSYDINDISWWFEDSIVLVKESGELNIALLPDMKIISEKTPKIHTWGIQSARAQNRSFFVLEMLDKILEETKESGRNDKKCGWRLISFKEHSVPELYKIWIGSQEYDSALQLADAYGLIPDDIFKAQWLSSDYRFEALESNLPEIEDKSWVLNQCLSTVCPDARSMNALLQLGLSLTDNEECRHMCDMVVESPIIAEQCLVRLRMLQYKDRLESFLGISNGRYFPKEYAIFRSSSMSEVALKFAKAAKLGALSFLYKMHMQTLNLHIFQILDEIPETTPPHDYRFLLPSLSAPQGQNIIGRREDWVEKKDILEALESIYHESEKNDVNPRDATENAVRVYSGSFWPLETEITEWYRARARLIDRLSGQIENSLILLELGREKGVQQLDVLWQDLVDLHRVVYTGSETGKDLPYITLSDWERMENYEKFKFLLHGVNRMNVLDRLREDAIPFMHRRHNPYPPPLEMEVEYVDSFLIAWLKEKAQENLLEICDVVFEDACRESSGFFFKDLFEMVKVGLDCIYLCTRVDVWDTLTSIVSHLKHVPISGNLSYEGLNKRIIEAEGHIEAGRILWQYQVAKPIGYFCNAKDDEKGAKQLLRLLFSKYGRRQPVKSDVEWVNLWKDIQALHMRAFPFLDKQFLFSEFCRGLLKAGKFTLAKSQLKNPGSSILTVNKVEKMVIQAAREYFYSASSLDSTDIEKARQCLLIVPESPSISAEIGLIDVVSVKLPALGVHLLPMQVRQARDPMEIVKMVLNMNPMIHLKVDELLDVAKLLGLKSSYQLAMVEASIAREAAASGDLEQALSLCRILVKKGYGSIWDLCAALAKGPELIGMDLKTRKELLGFALSNCDDESIADLLSIWNDLDILDGCNEIGQETGRNPITLADHEAYLTFFTTGEKIESESKESYQNIGLSPPMDDHDGGKVLEKFRKSLLQVTDKYPITIQSRWESLVKEQKKLVGFACLQLPWILQYLESISDMGVVGNYESTKGFTLALQIIISELANNNIPPKDELVCFLAQKALEKAAENEDMGSCGYLLNLSESHSGAKFLEQELKKAQMHRRSQKVMRIGAIYSSLQEASQNSKDPQERKQQLLDALMNDRLSSFSDGTRNGMDPLARSRSTLVALKSTQILSAVWPDVEVKTENLENSEAAISLFHSLTEKADNPRHFLLLISVLEEWGHIFQAQESPMEETIEETKKEQELPKDVWASEEWGNGWEELEGEQVAIAEISPKAIKTVNPLHSCWKLALKELVMGSHLPEAMFILDKALQMPASYILTEEEAEELIASIARESPLSACKVALLIPYSLSLAKGIAIFHEEVSKELSDATDDIKTEPVLIDTSFLVLALTSDLISSLGQDEGKEETLCVLCSQMLATAERCAASFKEDEIRGAHERLSEERLFMDFVFPCLILELTRMRHYSLAGILLLQVVRIHPPLMTLNAGHALLRSFVVDNNQHSFVETDDDFPSPRALDTAALWHDAGCLKQNSRSLKLLPNSLKLLKIKCASSLKLAKNALS